MSIPINTKTSVLSKINKPLLSGINDLTGPRHKKNSTGSSTLADSIEHLSHSSSESTNKRNEDIKYRTCNGGFKSTEPKSKNDWEHSLRCSSIEKLKQQGILNQGNDYFVNENTSGSDKKELYSSLAQPNFMGYTQYSSDSSWFVKEESRKTTHELVNQSSPFHHPLTNNDFDFKAFNFNSKISLVKKFTSSNRDTSCETSNYQISISKGMSDESQDLLASQNNTTCLDKDQREFVKPKFKPNNCETSILQKFSGSITQEDQVQISKTSICFKKINFHRFFRNTKASTGSEIIEKNYSKNPRIDIVLKLLKSQQQELPFKQKLAKLTAELDNTTQNTSEEIGAHASSIFTNLRNNSSPETCFSNALSLNSKIDFSLPFYKIDACKFPEPVPNQLTDTDSFSPKKKEKIVIDFLTVFERMELEKQRDTDFNIDYNLIFDEGEEKNELLDLTSSNDDQKLLETLEDGFNYNLLEGKEGGNNLQKDSLHQTGNVYNESQQQKYKQIPNPSPEYNPPLKSDQIDLTNKFQNNQIGSELSHSSNHQYPYENRQTHGAFNKNGHESHHQEGYHQYSHEFKEKHNIPYNEEYYRPTSSANHYQTNHKDSRLRNDSQYPTSDSVRCHQNFNSTIDKPLDQRNIQLDNNNSYYRGSYGEIDNCRDVRQYENYPQANSDCRDRLDFPSNRSKISKKSEREQPSSGYQGYDEYLANIDVDDEEVKRLYSKSGKRQQSFKINHPETKDPKGIRNDSKRSQLLNNNSNQSKGHSYPEHKALSNRKNNRFQERENTENSNQPRCEIKPGFHKKNYNQNNSRKSRRVQENDNDYQRKRETDTSRDQDQDYQKNGQSSHYNNKTYGKKAYSKQSQKNSNSNSNRNERYISRQSNENQDNDYKRRNYQEGSQDRWREEKKETKRWGNKLPYQNSKYEKSSRNDEKYYQRGYDNKYNSSQNHGYEDFEKRENNSKFPNIQDFSKKS